MTSIQQVSSQTTLAPAQATGEPSNQLIAFDTYAGTAESVSAKSWNERAIAFLDTEEMGLDHLIPNSVIQAKIDALAKSISKKFASLKKFNEWLDRHEMGSWYYQLAMFLVKLPIKSVRNIIRLLYNIIKAILYTVVHPTKATFKLAKFLVRLAHSLTQPETWAKMGASTIGACMGHSPIAGNPLSVIGIGIGVAMLLGGISAGALKSALQAETGNRWNAMKKQLFHTATELPETALTGLCLGFITGGIQRAINAYRIHSYEVSKNSEIDKVVQSVTKRWGRVLDLKREFDPVTGKITIDATYVTYGTEYTSKTVIMPGHFSEVFAAKNGWIWGEGSGLADGTVHSDYILYPSTLLPPQVDASLIDSGAITGPAVATTTSRRREFNG